MQYREQYGNVTLSILDGNGAHEETFRRFGVDSRGFTYAFGPYWWEIALLKLEGGFYRPEEIGLYRFEELWGRDDVAGYVSSSDLDQIREELTRLFGEKQ